MSTLTERMEAEVKHAQSTMQTWKRIVKHLPLPWSPFHSSVPFQSLYIAVPVCAYLGWKFLVGELSQTLLVHVEKRRAQFSNTVVMAAILKGSNMATVAMEKDSFRARLVGMLRNRLILYPWSVIHE